MIKNCIQVAAGERDADLVLRNARILHVHTGEILPDDIAIVNGCIAGVGDYAGCGPELDLEGRYVVPGFVNAHLHIESSMVTPAAYCREELRHGVTTLIADPHEVANVAGEQGIRFLLDALAPLPINGFIQLPSCVPSTPFEHAGARLEAANLAPLLGEPGVLGLGEMMNYPGVVGCDEAVLEKLRLAEGRVIDGHAPDVTGRTLQAYACGGISTDHESVTWEEAAEKLRAGMAVLVREGSASRNLEAILTGALAAGAPTHRMAFCSDDKHIAAIRREGTVRHCIQKGIALGMDVPSAYRMASWNAAQIYGLKNMGAVAPGYRADLVVLDNLENVAVNRVFYGGQPDPHERIDSQKNIGSKGTSSIRVAPLKPGDLSLPTAQGDFPVIGLMPGQINTSKLWVKQADLARQLADGSLCKLAVLERHHATGNVGVGLLAGYGLKEGAVASTVGHDSHNLIVAGCDDQSIERAVEAVIRQRGGYVVVGGGAVAAAVPLPVYGLMSDEEPEDFVAGLEAAIGAAHRQGVPPGIDPFIALSFLALPVLPKLRLTDGGLFDVEAFRFLYP